MPRGPRSAVVCCNTRPHRGHIMPSVCPSSEKSRRPTRCAPYQPPRSRKSKSSTPRLPRVLERLLDHPDPAEAFMYGWLTRFHCESPALYTVLAARRAEVNTGGRVRRLIVEAARFQPQRPNAKPVWLVLCWCIDGPGVVFHHCPSMRAALVRLNRELVADRIVFSNEPAGLGCVDVRHPKRPDDRHRSALGSGTERIL